MKKPKSLAHIGVAAFAVCTAVAASATTFNVNSISSLQSAINGAAAGDLIMMQNGTYTTSGPITINRVGTAANPIVIAADTIGGVTIGGTNGFQFSSPAAYVYIEGFKFTHAASISIPAGTSHCRLTRNIIELNIPSGSDTSYINIAGDDVQIDRNELRNKSTLGEMLDISGSGTQVARRLWVHHNYFHDFSSPGGNGAETIRWGLSGLSLSTGDGICEYNLFVRCDGENEMISNKSSGNTYRYNTVLDCPGGEISQRHGDNCLYYGNYMRNTQGMRIYGDNHQIFSNYLEGNTIGINMGNGDGDVHNGDPLTSHDRPDNNVVTFNTLINNDTQYQMGGRTGGLGATNTTFANNIIQGGTTAVSISTSAPYTTPTWSGNIIWNTTTIGTIPSSGYTVVNPLLATDANGVFHIQSGSPAINTATGTYTAVTFDMDGQARPSTGKDKGADEFSSAPVLATLLTPSDVGPASGNAVPADAPSFSPAGGTYSSTQSVTITSNGPTIHYTTDGSTPTSTSGTVYTSPVSISSTTTLKAVASGGGFTDSSVSSATYTINNGSVTLTSANGFFNAPLSASQNSVFTVQFDASASLSPSNVSIGLSQGNQTAYTGIAAMVRFNPSGFIDARDGSAFGASSIPFAAGSTYHFRMVVDVPNHIYSAFVTPPGGSELTVGSNFAFRTEQAGVTALDTTTISVNATPGGSTTVGPRTISGAAQVATPVFSPAPGSYTGTQNVSITSATSGATIRYTTDGSTPSQTSGTVYASPVAISATKTLKAIAYKAGFANSSVTSGTYTITGGTPAKFTIAGSAVTASTNDGNVPANTVDGNLATRWSAQGNPQWIQYDLGANKTVSLVKIAFYQGDTRVTTFDIQVSTNGTTWTNVLTNKASSGTSTALETFDFSDATARYVRINGHGNSVNTWNSLTETEVWGF